MAETLDRRLVGAVFDYRNARAAIDLLNDSEHGYEQLQRQPRLSALLLELVRAQGDDTADLGTIAQLVRGNREEE